MIIADAYDGFIVDLDGVVYRGDIPLPGAVATLRELRERGQPVVFNTNNPRGSPPVFAAKLRKMGIQAIATDVVTCGDAVAAYLTANGPRPVYVVGSAALRSQVTGAGSLILDEAHAAEAATVIISCHFELHYRELRAACAALFAGAELLATNPDLSFPTPTGPAPATGAIVAAVEKATGLQARVLGKPDPEMFHIAARRLGVTRPAVVGDSLDTDVAGGHAAGLPTVLVLSGVTDAAMLDTTPRPPDVVLPDLAALLTTSSPIGSRR